MPDSDDRTQGYKHYVGTIVVGWDCYDWIHFDNRQQ